MGCAGSAPRDPQEQAQLDVARGMAAAAKEHGRKGNGVGSLFKSQEERVANDMNNAMNMLNDPRMQAMQQQMMSQAMANPAMQQQMAMAQQIMGGMAASTPPVVQAQAVPVPEQGAAAKIMELKSLLDAGAITQEEFDQKKAELLESM